MFARNIYSAVMSVLHGGAAGQLEYVTNQVSSVCIMLYDVYDLLVIN